MVAISQRVHTSDGHDVWPDGFSDFRGSPERIEEHCTGNTARFGIEADHWADLICGYGDSCSSRCIG